MEATCREVHKGPQGCRSRVESVIEGPGNASPSDLLLGFVATDPFIPIARKATVQALGRHHIDPCTISDTATVVTELVANAVAAAAGRWIEVQVRVQVRHLVVDVWDPCDQLPPDSTPRPGDDEIDGRGLMIVAALATWVVIPTPERGGKSVVAYLKVPDTPALEPLAA